MSAEENEIYLHGTMSVLLWMDGLENQTSSYWFAELSVCGCLGKVDNLQGVPK